MSELVLRLDEIPEGGVIRRPLGEHEIAIFRIGSDVYAIGAVCPHRRGPLDEASAEDFIVTCPWHGWRFDVRTGVSPTHPGRVACYTVKRSGDQVHISSSG